MINEGMRCLQVVLVHSLELSSAHAARLGLENTLLVAQVSLCLKCWALLSSGVRGPEERLRGKRVFLASFITSQAGV